jgi:hypothetical protein
MAGKTVSPVQRQLGRARRRLFVQGLLDRLAWCWAGALALAACWFLVQPFFIGNVEELRWAGAAGLAGAATVLAVGLAWWRAPRPLDVALAVDARLGLKERVTTALGLSPAEARSPAGRALLADVNERIGPLDVKGRFPVRLTWPAALVPAAAAVLALVALFYEPQPGAAQGGPGADGRARAEAGDIEQKLKEIRKAVAKPRPRDGSDGKELKELEDAWNRLLDKRVDLRDTDKVREQVQSMRSLEEKLKDRAGSLKAQVEKNQALLRQLQKVAQVDPGGRKLEPKKGPADDKEGPLQEVQEALAKGQADRARDALEKLQKKLGGGKLSKQELRRLQEQLQDLRNRLQRLAGQQDRKDRLQRERDRGELDEEQLRQALEQLEREGQDLEDLARLLDECRDCLKKGDGKGAQGKLKALAGRLEEMKLTEEELRDLEENAGRLEAVRAEMLERLNGQAGGGPPGQRRPAADDGPTRSHDARQRAEQDPKGQLRISGFGRGGRFSKVPAKEVPGAFRQAVQDAPQAIERQRISPEASDMLKGYYENLGGQKKN